MSNDIMVNYTNSKLYFTDNWTKEDIIYLLTFFYIALLIGTGVLYLKSMYNQYRNAHNKWYGIVDSPKKRH